MKEKQNRVIPKPTAANIDGTEAEDLPPEITMDSFNRLMCMRCYKYDCHLHSKYLPRCS